MTVVALNQQVLLLVCAGKRGHDLRRGRVGDRRFPRTQREVGFRGRAGGQRDLAARRFEIGKVDRDRIRSGGRVLLDPPKVRPFRKVVVAFAIGVDRDGDGAGGPPCADGHTREPLASRRQDLAGEERRFGRRDGARRSAGPETCENTHEDRGHRMTREYGCCHDLHASYFALPLKPCATIWIAYTCAAFSTSSSLADFAPRAKTYSVFLSAPLNATLITGRGDWIIPRYFPSGPITCTPGLVVT